MSHPISNNMEYLKQILYQEDNATDYFTFRHRPSDAESKWHSIFRRMSINIQRDEGTPEQEIVSGTVDNPSEHERALMLSIPHSDGNELNETQEEDDTLPNLEEIVQDGTMERPPCTHNYFENPFDSDADTVYLHEEENNKSVHPLSTITDDSRKPKDHKAYVAPSMIEVPAKLQKQKVEWVKTFDKIKLANSLGGPTRRRSSTVYYTTTRQPLAPYYPSAFTPGYLSLLCRDEHGRKAPPILFDALNISITDSTIDHNSSHRLWTFRIDIQYGEIKWVIYRTIIEFYNLHLTLKFKYISGFISEPPPSFPSQLAHLTNAALTSMRIAREQEDSMWRDIALKRRDALEIYLKELIQHASMNVNYELCEFLELSAVSIVKDMGWKGKEGYLEYNTNLPSLRLFKWQKWQKEWLILRDSYIAFCKDISSNTPAGVLLFDKYLKVSRTQSTFGSIHQTHFIISNASRRIEVKAPTSRHTDEWIDNLNKVQKESPWIMNHRFGSFAPIRECSNARWFVDGQDYFEAVAQAILSAKSEIYIEDWWLSPQLYLRRPPKGNEEYRLDRLLKRKACQGVMIYIVIYKNVSVALPLDSQYTRDWMQHIHPNIIVQRHANLTSSPFWAHHEKIIVIDNRLAFVGGLDLCFGQ
ncbi:Phospholipase D1, partial [Rhizopus stolonifer]